jgi:REP element-mobilizing transposase RayT
MPQSLAAIYLHLVFSTKDRAPFLRDTAFRQRLHEYLGGVSKTLECAPLRVGGVEDHVHLLARFARTHTIADWVKELKRVSSIWVHERGEEYREFHWQHGYGVFSVSHSNRDRVMEYIDGQELHHRRMTYQDEVRGLFRKHDVEFDERYVWD